MQVHQFYIHVDIIYTVLTGTRIYFTVNIMTGK